MDWNPRTIKQLQVGAGQGEWSEQTPEQKGFFLNTVNWVEIFGLNEIKVTLSGFMTTDYWMDRIFDDN